MEIFIELSIIIGITVLIAGIMRLLKQPLIIGYILAGIIVGPYFLNVVRSTETIAVFSQIGVALLLFIVGFLGFCLYLIYCFNEKYNNDSDDSIHHHASSVTNTDLASTYKENDDSLNILKTPLVNPVGATDTDDDNSDNSHVVRLD